MINQRTRESRKSVIVGAIPPMTETIQSRHSRRQPAMCQALAAVRFP
jgi:hypothetical protein